MNDEEVLWLIKQGKTAREIADILNVPYNRVWKKYSKVVGNWRGWDKRLPERGDILEHISGELFEVLTVKSSHFNIRSLNRDKHRTLTTRMWVEGKVKYRHHGEQKKKNSKADRIREPQLYDTVKRGGEQYIICEIRPDCYIVKKNEHNNRRKEIPKDFERYGFRLINYAPVEVSHV